MRKLTLLFLGISLSLSLIAQTPESVSGFDENWSAEKSDISHSSNYRGAWGVQFNYSGMIASSAGCETDGNYFYVTIWNKADILKYDLTGNLIETFSIPGVTGLRDLAFDGTYFYGGASNNSIYQMDFTNKSLVSTISSPNETVRHICYDPINDAFWVGNWATNLSLVDKSGTVIRTISSSDHGFASIYGTAFDTITPGGPYIWSINADNSVITSITQILVSTGKPTGLFHECSDISTLGKLGGGLWIHPDIVNGTVTLGGLIQGVSIFGYNIASTIPDNYDIALTSIDINDNTPVTNPVIISGIITNNGLQTITSFDLSYTIDAGTPVVENLTGLNILPFKTYNYSHSTAWNASIGMHDIEVSISNPNGNQDEYTANDMLSVKTFCNEGINGTKRVLIEEATGAWCGYCPDGALVLEEIIQNNNGNVIGISHHNSDGMDFTAGNTLNSAFVTGYPMGYIDRYKFDGTGTVGISRGDWAAKAAERLNTTTPVNINITSLAFDQASGKLDLDVDVEFVDHTYGDLRITVILTENKITGSGPDYDQKNYYDGTSGHPLFGLGNPIIGYEHMHVSRTFLTDTWGDKLDAAGVTTFTKDNVISKQYSTTIANWVPGRMHAVVLVSKYDIDIENRYVLNVVETVKFTNSVITDEKSQSVGDIYPNPVNSVSKIDFKLENTSDVSFTVLNAMGQVVQTKSNQKYASGDHSIYFSTEELIQGTYFVILQIDAENYTRVFLKN